jgi:hypothetical protein
MQINILTTYSKRWRPSGGFISISCGPSRSNTTDGTFAETNGETKNSILPESFLKRYTKTNDFTEIKSYEDLPTHWKMLESRVINRKTKPKQPGVSSGRGRRLPSAWDHEHV